VTYKRSLIIKLSEKSFDDFFTVSFLFETVFRDTCYAKAFFILSFQFIGFGLPIPTKKILKDFIA